MGHGSWEGKLGRVGVWEHGNLVGKGRESKAQEPSRQRGKVGAKVRFRCGPVIEEKGQAASFPRLYAPI